MTAHAPLRLGVLSSHLIQYFSPLYRHLAKRVDAFQVGYFRHVERDGEMKAIYDPNFGAAFIWDVDLRSGYEFTSFGLPEAPFRYSSRDLARLARGIYDWQKRFRPDVVMVPGWTLPDVVAARTLAAAGVPFILRPEGRVPRGGPVLRGFARDAWCRALVRRAAGAAVVGSSSREELLRLGMPAERLASSPYVIDTDLWRRALVVAGADRDVLRARFGIAPNEVAYLTVSKLVDYKRPRELVEAFIALFPTVPAARLVIVGDGELRAALAQRVEEAGVASRVSFAGFVNQTELPKYYAAADVFVLTSIETWGLVANEALLAGLPLAVSVDAGCVRDLVVDGVTGRRLYIENPAQVVDALAYLADPAVRRTMRPNLEQLAARYTLETAADGVVNAARLALGMGDNNARSGGALRRGTSYSKLGDHR
jgi:glycosyltransferase involved in cell wall biosynthesis